jgi:hypothetical protein
MGRIIPGLLLSLLVACSLSARANAQDIPRDLLLRPPIPTVTMKKYPSICWILRTRRPAWETITFTLRDSRSIKPILEVQLLNSTQTETDETCVCVSLKDYDILLEPGILYPWHIFIARNPGDPRLNTTDIVVDGKIERCAEEECLIQEMPPRCDQNFAQDLASQGFYYDSFSCLCDLVKANPDDRTLRRMQAALMRRAGFIHSPN